MVAAASAPPASAPALVHTQYALPLRCPCPAVVTIHDLSFERRRADGPTRPARLPARRSSCGTRAARVLTVSERTKRDLVARYGLATGARRRDAERRRSGLPPGGRERRAAERRTSSPSERSRSGRTSSPRSRRRGRRGCSSSSSGRRRTSAWREELRDGGARLEGYVSIERLAALYRGAACLVQASRSRGLRAAGRRGDGVAARPSSPCPTRRSWRSPETRPSSCREDELADGIRRAIAERDRLAAAGLERARAFSWEATAGATRRASTVEALGR